MAGALLSNQPSKENNRMNREFQQYRFARIEAHNVARARLESQFMTGRIDFDKLERAIERELAEPTICAPWRRSEIEQMGCRDGARMAALEFFWAHRQELQRESFATATETSSLRRRH
jgi:hypothetical protein